MYSMDLEINYFDEIYNILKNSNKKWLYVSHIYKKLISNIDKSLIEDDFQQIFLLHVMTMKYYYNDVNVVCNTDGCLEYIVYDNHNDIDEDDEEEEEEDPNETKINDKIFVSCPGYSEREEEDDKPCDLCNNDSRGMYASEDVYIPCPGCSCEEDEDYVPEEEEEDDEEDYVPEEDEEDEEDEEEEEEDYDKSNDELLYLLTKDDIIDYAVDNLNNRYIRQLILKYRENDNNIMHILFKNRKNKEIEKLLNSECIHLLTEENKEGKCPIDYMNNTILKKVIKECINNNNNLNTDINTLYNQSFELRENIYYLSITLSCSMLFILVGLIKIH